MSSDPDEIISRFCFSSAGFMTIILIAVFARPAIEAPDWWVHAVAISIAIGIPCFVAAGFLFNRMDVIKELKEKPSRHLFIRLMKLGFYSLIFCVTLIFTLLSPYAAGLFFLASIGLYFLLPAHIIYRRYIAPWADNE